MDSILTMGTSSSAHTFGNIVEAIKIDILSKFPPEYFKYTHVSSQLAFRELRAIRGNALAEFRKQEKPKIYIRPMFEMADDNIPFFGTLITNHMASGTGAISQASLMPVLQDATNHVELDFRMNRDKISFDVQIAVSTLVQQLDLYKTLQNMVPWDAPHTKIMSLESMIPKQMIQYLATNANITMDDRPGTIRTVVSYLQSHGKYPITYKIRNSSSNDEFFMYYEVPVLITYSDITIDDGSKKGMVDDSYGISFRVSAEFNHPGAYLIRSLHGSPRIIPSAIRVSSDNDTPDELFPLFTSNHIYESNNEELSGFSLYFVTAFMTEKSLDHKEDFIDLDAVIDENYIQILKKYDFTHIPTDVLMRSRVFLDDKELEYGVDYYIDWNQMKLFIPVSDCSKTYRLILYANVLKFQEEILTLIELHKTDKTYDSLNHPKEIREHWIDREGAIFKDANDTYFKTKNEETVNHCEFTNMTR